ncbi:hypothetical protein EV175_002328 [Coemansia sp. RSA 1933]|nr:hypothetical protein EV175_002328 [Coemansia sp. RSA 1933]
MVETTHEASNSIADHMKSMTMAISDLAKLQKEQGTRIDEFLKLQKELAKQQTEQGVDLNNDTEQSRNPDKTIRGEQVKQSGSM